MLKKEKEKVKPVREEGGGDAVLEADLGGLGGGEGGEVDVSGEEEVAMDEEAGGGGGGGNGGHGGAFGSENVGLHPLRLASAFAEAP